MFTRFLMERSVGIDIRLAPSSHFPEANMWDLFCIHVKGVVGEAYTGTVGNEANVNEKQLLVHFCVIVRIVRYCVVRIVIRRCCVMIRGN